MFVKYLPSHRTDFLENGLFRITQPKYLNDPSGEGVFTPFFNDFSDADLKYAYERYKVSIFYDGPDVTKEFLIENFLLPNGSRYSIDESPSLKGFEGFQTMEEYDRSEAKKFTNNLNSHLLNFCNKTTGIFSLTDSLTNKDMWLLYAQQGKGLAVSFKSDHSFFKVYQPNQVTYKNANRASISYYEGIIRINGIAIHDNQKNIEETIRYYLENIDRQDFFERLFLTKNERWKTEKEYRIIFNLSDSDLQKPNEVFLKKIPFSCFDTLTFGWDLAEDEINKIKKFANENPELSHLKFKQVKYGELEKYDELELFNI